MNALLASQQQEVDITQDRPGPPEIWLSGKADKRKLCLAYLRPTHSPPMFLQNQFWQM